jgi:hypothetical protein
VFTLQKQHSFHEHVYDESEECESCLRNIDGIDDIFYTWDVVENVPAICIQINFIPRVRRRPISGGGGRDGRFRESSETGKMNDDFIEDIPSFLERSCFQIVPEDGNGHCGVLALQRAKRRYLGAPNNDVTPQGRQELVDAYRKHRAAFLKDHGSWFNVTDEDIDRRISIHLAAKKQLPCSDRAWVSHMDLVIWSMETEQTVHVVRRGEAHVDVFL